VLLGSLIRAASEKSQIIISTQSVALLNEFTIDDLIIVERADRASVFKRCDANDFSTWLETYSIGELWEKNILGGRPKE
jgi:predicted ATPase